MADNIEFRSDMADEGHIGEAIGLYEADKRIVHLSAPNVGNRSVPAADVSDAERIFWRLRQRNEEIRRTDNERTLALIHRLR